MRRSIRKRLVFVISLLVVVVLSVEGVIALTVMQNSFKEKMDESYMERTELFSSHIKGWMQNDMGLLVAAESVVSASASAEDAPKLVSVLTDLTNSNEEVTMAYIGFVDGNLLNGSGWVPPEGWDCRTRDWYTQAAEAAGDIIVSSPYVDDSTGNIVVTVSQYFEVNVWKGVCAVDLDMALVLKNLESTVVKYGNEGDYVFITGNDGTIISHPNSEYVSLDGNLVNIADVNNGLYESGANSSDAITDYDGTKVRVVKLLNEDLDWNIYYVSPDKYYNEAVENNKNAVFFIYVICVILSIIAATIIALRIANPIAKVGTQVDEICEGFRSGNADLTKRVTTKNKDEIGVLVNGINALLDSLTNVIVRINDATNSLVSDVDILRGAAKTTSENVENISATMQQMSASSEQTSASTTAMAGQMSDIAQLTEDVKNNTIETTKKLNDGLEKVKVTQSDIHEKDEAMRARLDNAIALLNEKISATKKVEEIQTMTEGISDVASQTNLLSLNASIEAARAGEAGKGFAVVADEIGSLANNSADMARKIQEVSNEVLSIVEELVRAAESVSTIMLDIAEENSQQKDEILDEYNDSLNNCYNAMSAVTANSQEIAVSIEHIQSAVKSIDVAMGENTNGISSVANGANDLVEASGDVLSRADSVGSVSANLQDEINKFRLN